MEVEEDSPLDYNLLNNKQKFSVDHVVEKIIENLKSPLDQFFLEVAGKAGSGKTTVIKNVKVRVQGRLCEMGSEVAFGDMVKFTAYTGSAAKLLPTPHHTLHQLLRLPCGSSSTTPLEKLGDTQLRILQDTLKGLRVIVIDEKSFIGCYFLYLIDERLKQIWGNTRPFGGISIILLGDFNQLAPVGDQPLYLPDKTSLRMLPGLGWEAFDLESFKVIFLEKNQRQADDPDYMSIAEKLSKGTIDKDAHEKLSERSLLAQTKDVQKSFWENGIYLCARKKDFAEHNFNRVKEIEDQKILVKAMDEPRGVRVSEDKAGGLRKTLPIANGMKVMLTSNISVRLGLTNGTRGTVVGIIFYDQTDNFPDVLVQFDGYRGDSVLDDIPRVYLVSAITFRWKQGGKKSKKYVSRTMLPLVAAYAMSIHKSQGQTLGDVILNLGSNEFAPGLTTVGLTRNDNLRRITLYPMPSLERLQKFAKKPAFAHLRSFMEKRRAVDLAAHVID